MQDLFGGILAFEWQQVVMILIGLVLIWLAIGKKYEPTLLLPIGFGTILTNIPLSAAVGEHGPLQLLLTLELPPNYFPC